MNYLSFDETTLYDYEISGLKKLGYHLEIPEKTVFHHFNNYLIATKRIGTHKVKVYIETAPAHFFTIEIPTSEGKTFLLKTGSGRVDDYLENLQPTIELIEKSMLVVEEKP